MSPEVPQVYLNVEMESDNLFYTALSSIVGNQQGGKVFSNSYKTVSECNTLSCYYKFKLKLCDYSVEHGDFCIMLPPRVKETQY